MRELNVYSEILTINQLNKIKNFDNIKGIILSGGPATITKKFPKIPKEIFQKKNPSIRHMLWFAVNYKTIWRKR